MSTSRLDVPASYVWSAFDPRALSERKHEQGLTVSVCLPARDEAETIADIVLALRCHLVTGLGLVDEVVVIDDHSDDDTATRARDAGATVVGVETILPEEPPGRGKGNVIWRSLAACSGDLICWVDADIRNFGAHFVTGLVGPLLTRPDIAFVKGHYRRPLGGRPTGGGRVTELMARPLLSRFFPQLAAFAQPLSGEYAGRRSLLESVPVVEGWGVDVALLIDAFRSAGMGGLAQVDLGVREHRNRPLDELAVPAMAVLLAVLERTTTQGEGTALLRFDGESGTEAEAVPHRLRPPMATRPGYRHRRSPLRATSSAVLERNP